MGRKQLHEWSKRFRSRISSENEMFSIKSENGMDNEADLDGRFVWIGSGDKSTLHKMSHTRKRGARRHWRRVWRRAGIWRACRWRWLFLWMRAGAINAPSSMPAWFTACRLQAPLFRNSKRCKSSGHHVVSASQHAHGIRVADTEDGVHKILYSPSSNRVHIQ